MSNRSMTEIDITFPNRIDTKTFQREVFNARKALDAKVEYFSDDSDLWGEFSVHFVGKGVPSLYSERLLAPRTRTSIESMEVRPFTRMSNRRMSNIEIYFTDGITWSTFKHVLTEVKMKFGARSVHYYKFLGRFHVDFDAPIEPDRAFVLYGRKLSDKARRSIKSMDVCRIERPVRDDMNWLLFPSAHHDEFPQAPWRYGGPSPVLNDRFTTRDGIYDVVDFRPAIDGDATDATEWFERMRELYESWLSMPIDGFRIDARPPLFGGGLDFWSNSRIDEGVHLDFGFRRPRPNRDVNDNRRDNVED